jgi:hypothetical protein
MTALSLSLSLLWVLAFVAWWRHVEAQRPLPPHEKLQAEVESLKRDVDAIKAWASKP